MKKALFSLMMGALLALSSCTPGPTPTDAPKTLTPTLALPTATALPPTPAPVPQGRTLLVTSTADSGPGTLRQAMQDVQNGDTITFDPSVFPPDAPATIALSSSLPELNQGDLTIDASNAGVVLDGSKITSPDSQRGLSISSDNNIVRGLQIVGFSDAGIGLYGGAEYNVIGGDRSVGDGPLGQGNLISGNGSFGVGLWDEGTSHNTIQGNYIGINVDGTATWGHAREGIHSNGATQNLITDNVIGGNESAGVYLCCVLEGRNTVSGNLIGVGPKGDPVGNQLAGVIIDRTRYNVVGPGNSIAHNPIDGISFWEDSPNNTVTQNSIHDNGERGIGVSDIPSALQSPIILNWDLQAGTVSGTACANCTVEIFSDTGDEGANYEGQAEAVENGAFTFVKGAPLTGPFLTTTATGPGGSTSEFSPPTKGSIQNLSLQNGNPLPMFRLQTNPSVELADNRIGGVGGVGEAESLWNTGAKWMHLIVDYYGRWQYVDWEREEYALDPQEEQLVDDLLSHGVKIQLVLDVWEWQNRIVDYRSVEGIQKYLNWVRYLVRHFKGRIEYYEILNEPDINLEVPSGLPWDTYVNLVKRTVPVIREEDPQAKIVVGSIPDTRFDHVREWMWGLLNSEIMPLVDGFSWHPMFGAAPSDDPRGVREPDMPQMANYWENYPAFVEEIMRVSTSAGFEGEYFATDMIWRTPANPHVAEPYGFTDVSVAKYYARAIIIHLGLNVITGVAVVPAAESVIRALCTVMAGAQPVDLPVVIESGASNIKYYGFALPDGDRLFALWTDGVAVDDDPGVPATFTFPATSAQKVIGIDVLNGFSQGLITQTENGNLVILDLLVKDYPIILRLTNE